jgi:thymidylate synthase (FAD)
MKLINPSFEIYEQGPGLEGIYEQIELAGRTCYKSKRPEGQTAKDFVDRMIASQHYAMLEHGTVYLIERWKEGTEIKPKYDNNPYSKVKVVNFYGETWKYITTNLRVLVENDWLDDLQYICEPTEYHERRVTVRFTTDRGVSHEFVRHRVFSFAQESTRYCNYSKDKFGNELTFIIPSWVDTIEPGTYEDDHKFPSMWGHDHWMESIWFDNMIKCEKDYITMVRECLTPQQARQILPNSLKTELVMTGFVSDWQHFFDLRARGTTGAPHPDAKALAEPLMGEFYKRGLI